MSSEQTGARRRRPAVVAASAGLLLAGVGTIGWGVSQQVGPPPAPPAAEASAAGPPQSSASTSATRSPTSTPTTSATSTTRMKPSPSPSPKTANPMAASTPTAIRIPGIDVASPVHGLGLDSAGQLMVPSGERYNEVAWYDGSPTPGQTGPAVLEGHVTGSGSNLSVFFELGATKTGDRVEIDRADGSTATFEVTEVRKYPKADFPRVAVYGATPGPELRIITCGGTYDAAARRHLDNVVVFAELVKS